MTVRQVVHHYADDHINTYVRFKLAMTEEAPLIRGYAEGLWAELPDARSGPIEPSLQLLAALAPAVGAGVAIATGVRLGANLRPSLFAVR